MLSGRSTGVMIKLCLRIVFRSHLSSKQQVTCRQTCSLLIFFVFSLHQSFLPRHQSAMVLALREHLSELTIDVLCSCLSTEMHTLTQCVCALNHFSIQRETTHKHKHCTLNSSLSSFQEASSDQSINQLTHDMNSV